VCIWCAYYFDSVWAAGLAGHHPNAMGVRRLAAIFGVLVFPICPMPQCLMILRLFTYGFLGAAA
jgi:hypothetical protein